MAKKSKKKKKKSGYISTEASKINNWVKKETTLPDDVMGL